MLLHGANGSSSEIEPLAAALREHFEVFVPDWLGHGGREVPADIDVPALAADFIDAMDGRAIEHAWIAGYSVGGYLALYLAHRFPERVAGVFTLGTKFVHDAKTIAHWTYLASVERLEPRPRAMELARSHAPRDWREVARLNSRFFAGLGRESPLDDDALRAIDCPVMLANSNRDPIVPWEETLATARLLPHNKLVMFYGLAHPLRTVPVGSLAKALGDWVDAGCP